MILKNKLFINKDMVHTLNERLNNLVFYLYASWGEKYKPLNVAICWDYFNI